MTNLTMGTVIRGRNLVLARGRVQTVRLYVYERYRCWRRYRMILAELRQNSPDQLAELGIHPTDIGRIAAFEGSRTDLRLRP